ncbi:MAG: hypothetical protein U0P81_15325 [Holophagaceae bacterium]
MRRLRYAFLTLLGLACVGAFVACSGSSTSRAQPVSVPPAFATVASLVATSPETEEPKDLDSLDLAGFDTEDEHAFDSLFPAN